MSWLLWFVILIALAEPIGWIVVWAHQLLCKHEWKRGITDPYKSKWREFRQCQKCDKVEYREFSFKHEWSS